MQYPAVSRGKRESAINPKTGLTVMPSAGRLDQPRKWLGLFDSRPYDFARLRYLRRAIVVDLDPFRRCIC